MFSVLATISKDPAANDTTAVLVLKGLVFCLNPPRVYTASPSLVALTPFSIRRIIGSESGFIRRSRNMQTDPLKEKWLQRLNDAKLRLEFARSFVREVTEDCASGAIVAPDSGLAYRQALSAKRAAVDEFARIAEIVKNLLVHNTIPDEDFDQEAKGQLD